MKCCSGSAATADDPNTRQLPNRDSFSYEKVTNAPATMLAHDAVARPESVLEPRLKRGQVSCAGESWANDTVLPLPEAQSAAQFYATSDVQAGHRVAVRGIAVLQYWHSFVVTAAGARILLYCRTMRKMTNATSRNWISAAMRMP